MSGYVNGTGGESLLGVSCVPVARGRLSAVGRVGGPTERELTFALLIVTGFGGLGSRAGGG